MSTRPGALNLMANLVHLDLPKVQTAFLDLLLVNVLAMSSAGAPQVFDRTRVHSKRDNDRPGRTAIRQQADNPGDDLVVPLTPV